MPKLWIYRMDDGTSAIRVVKNPADNPAALSVSDYGKLSFDSLNPAQPRILALRRRRFAEVAGVTTAGAFLNLEGTAQPSHYADRTGNQHGYAELLGRTMPEINYPPLITTKRFSGEWMRINHQNRFLRVANSVPLVEEGFSESHASFGHVHQASPAGQNYVLLGVRGGISGALAIPGYTGWCMGMARPFDNQTNSIRRDTSDSHTVVWGLPADNRPIPYTSGPGGPNRTVAQVTEQEFKVARNGYNLLTATGDQLLIDSDRSPVVIIATGQLTIAAGATQTVALPSGINYGGNLFVDAITNIAGSPTYHPVLIPGNFFGSNLGVQSRQVGNSVQFRNVGTVTMQVRYFVYGEDDAPASSGGGQVMRTFMDGGEQVFQFLRPGANPNALRLRDILLDTRFPYLPIVREGYLNIGSTQTSATVNFTNTGFTPYVLYMVALQRTPTDIHYAGGIAHLVLTNVSGNRSAPLSGYGCYAQINNSSIVFNVNPAGVTDHGEHASKVVGIRYYVVALPN